MKIFIPFLFILRHSKIKTKVHFCKFQSSKEILFTLSLNQSYANSSDHSLKTSRQHETGSLCDRRMAELVMSRIV